MIREAISLFAILLMQLPADGPAEGPQVDFPSREWMKNIGSRLDGSGMCVFTSIEMAAIWSGIEEFRGFRDWCAQNYPGGGYPEKVDKLIAAYCNAKGISNPGYSQHEVSSTEVLVKALKSGRMPAVTLYRSPRYNGVIYHMVNSVHWDEKYAATMDNNKFGNDPLPPVEWGSPQEMENRVKLGGKIWVFVWNKHGPPPVPRPRK